MNQETQNVRPSVLGYRNSNKFKRRNYGAMNASSRILSVFKQSPTGAEYSVVDLSKLANVYEGTVRSTLSKLGKQGMLQSKLKGDNSRTLLWSIKV